MSLLPSFLTKEYWRTKKRDEVISLLDTVFKKVREGEFISTMKDYDPDGKKLSHHTNYHRDKAYVADAYMHEYKHHAQNGPYKASDFVAFIMKWESCCPTPAADKIVKEWRTDLMLLKEKSPDKTAELFLNTASRLIDYNPVGQAAAEETWNFYDDIGDTMLKARVLIQVNNYMYYMMEKSSPEEKSKNEALLRDRLLFIAPLIESPINTMRLALLALKKSDKNSAKEQKAIQIWSEAADRGLEAEPDNVASDIENIISNGTYYSSLMPEVSKKIISTLSRTQSIYNVLQIANRAGGMFYPLTETNIGERKEFAKTVLNRIDVEKMINASKEQIENRTPHLLAEGGFTCRNMLRLLQDEKEGSLQDEIAQKWGALMTAMKDSWGPRYVQEELEITDKNTLDTPLIRVARQKQIEFNAEHKTAAPHMNDGPV